MWNSENERLGLKACTPAGHVLHEVADMTGLIGLVLLIAMPVYVVYRVGVHKFAWQICWLFLIPLFVGIVGRVLWEISWKLAAKKGFHYDDETRTAHWIEGENAQVFPRAS
jgi:hypothetical protein